MNSNEERSNSRLNGQTWSDPAAASALIRSVNKSNLVCIRDLNMRRIQQLKEQMRELSYSPRDAVIIIISVDDPNGIVIVEALMPEHDWQPMRDRGEPLYAEGIVPRAIMQEALEEFDADAANKLRSQPDKTQVVIVGFGVAQVYIA